MGVRRVPHDERSHNASLAGSDQCTQLVLDPHSLGYILNQHASFHPVYSSSIPFVKDIEKHVQAYPQEPYHLADGLCDCRHFDSASIRQQEVVVGC